MGREPGGRRAIQTQNHFCAGASHLELPLHQNRTFLVAAAPTFGSLAAGSSGDLAVKFSASRVGSGFRASIPGSCTCWRADGYQGVENECGGGAPAAAISHSLALCEGAASCVLEKVHPHLVPSWMQQLLDGLTEHVDSHPYCA